METRTIDDVLRRVEEVQEWDVSGDRERELMRFVPADYQPKRHARYLRDEAPAGKPSPGPAAVSSATMRAKYLLSEAERRWNGPASAEARSEAKASLRRAEEAAWVAGVPETRLEEVSKQSDGVLILISALRRELEL